MNQETLPKLHHVTPGCRVLAHSTPRLFLRSWSAMAKRLATDDEIRQLEKWNNTDYPFPQKCLQELFKEQVEKTPDSTALVFETQSLTYRELDSRAAELGAHLRDLGVSPDVLVAVKVDRNVSMIISLLGIHQAGGAYVPIDPAYPADRRQYMIEDSQAKVLVTQASLYADDDGSEVPEGVVVVVLDEATGYLSPHSPSKAMYGANDLAPATLALTVTPDCLAYVIYTSGSTGKPKGVMLPHSNVVNLLYAFYMELGASAKDTLLAITTFCFDISVLEIFLPLIFGMKLVLASRMDATNGDLLQDLMARHDVTIMQATPTTWQVSRFAIPTVSTWHRCEGMCPAARCLPGLMAKRDSLARHAHPVWRMPRVGAGRAADAGGTRLTAF
ncbi:hypothetical protein CYMTET_7343 [Cymbomonas tetramitiformis]|uniref:AMP-dependent synthetase/ligase domain-containing protein n=1 Tax=Cymbomonas tetramitiformis TaxID=36881 RepID=A0AAE0LGZ3_9CHLO|nr:hypothetical protein CYMTET_7343 [Cymbomonas tetramitiformis]